MSPYHAYGELNAVLNAPRLKYSGPIETIARAQLDETVRALNDLAVTAEIVGDHREHPWRDSTRTFYAEDDLETIRELTIDFGCRLADIIHQSRTLEETFGFPPIRTFPDVETAISIAEVLARSPGVSLAVLENDAWNAPPHEAIALIECGRKIEQLKVHLGQQFSAEIMDRNHSEDIIYVEQKVQGILSVFAFLDSRYRAVKKRWKTYRLPSYRGSLLEQAEEMKRVEQLRQEQQVLMSQEAVAQQLFGGLWQGVHSSWDVLENYIRWVSEFRSICARHGLRNRILEVASRPAPDVSAVHVLRTAATAALSVFASLRLALGWATDYLVDESIEDIAQRVHLVRENLMLGPRWASFESTRQRAAEGLAAEMLPAAMAGEVPFSQLATAFLRAFYQQWLSRVVQSRLPLRDFHTLTHQQRVSEFRTLDEQVVRENRAALISKLRDTVQNRLQTQEATAALPFLRREMARQRGLTPLRKTMKLADAAIRAIKPCFMMSPLSVAQFLDGTLPTFDLVIFDEASQLPPEDAVGAIIRGKRLVVVGDPKQLPPTNFFSVMNGQETASLGEDGLPLFEDSESILEEFMGAGVPQCRLKWHYRSTHESLITFSNVNFYDADLYTFPSVETGTDTSGLQFEYIEDGVYEGKGLNMAEARRVVDAVVQHAKMHPDLSLGVGTFNMRQQLAIQDELERQRRQDPSLEFFFARKDDPFFVKNLENIQGDERDVIFISVTYAKGADGRLRYNFGPLNGQNGWRRLNVLTTRARQSMRVFSSMKGEEINIAGTTSVGAKLLREFLLYAEHGRLESIIANTSADTDSPFEREVLIELTRRGLTLVPQVGVAGYRIDFGILDDVMPGRFLCGIECDGVAYHSSETARDRDRLRQQILEARGWTIYRVWSTDWFKDRHGQIERLLGLIEQTKTRVRRKGEVERAMRTDLASVSIVDDEEKVEPTSGSDKKAKVEYKRPVAALYRFTSGEGRYTGKELLDAPASQLLRAVASVVETEAPIHSSDLASRVVAMWGSRAGARIVARIAEVCQTAERDGVLKIREGFISRPDGSCQVRSRAGTKIPAERIAPEEYREAILLILKGGHSFSRSVLINETRTVFGFSRTGSQLEAIITTTIDSLLVDGIVGEGSAGITLRC